MRKLLLAATAGLAIVSAGALTTTHANAMPVGAPAGLADEMNLTDQVALCFYVDGWNGPGLYECGFRFRRGMGWHGRRDGFRDGNRGRGGFEGNRNRGRGGFEGNRNRGGNVQGNRTGGNRTGGGNRSGAGVK